MLNKLMKTENADLQSENEKIWSEPTLLKLSLPLDTLALSTNGSDNSVMGSTRVS